MNTSSRSSIQLHNDLYNKSGRRLCCFFSDYFHVMSIEYYCCILLESNYKRGIFNLCFLCHNGGKLNTISKGLHI